MTRVLVRRGLLGRTVEQVDLDAGAGVTPRKLVAMLREQTGAAVLIAVDGKLVEGDDPAFDFTLRAGQTIVVCPRTGGEIIVSALVYAIISAAVSYAVSYAVQALNPRPKPPGIGQERGDDTSPTYSSWGLQTQRGPGFVRAIIWGRFITGGQVIWTDVLASRTSPTAIDDRLRVILALGEGPIYRIGNLTAVPRDALGGFTGGIPGPPIPSGISINGNLVDHLDPLPGIRVWTRPGTQDQPPLPAPFSGVASTETVNLELTGPARTQVYTIDEFTGIEQIRLVFVFPAGCYVQSPTTGQPMTLQNPMQVRWRPAGSGAIGTPILMQQPTVGVMDIGAGGPHYGFHAATITLFYHTIAFPAGGNGFPIGATGPIEIVITNNGLTGQTSYVNQLFLRDVVLIRAHTLRYPRTPLVALELQAGTRWSGGDPNFELLADGQLVRVWDEIAGWSPECWDAPPAPWNFSPHAPGQSPAWMCLAFLRARYGLRNYFPEHRIDLPAFRRWAANCQMDPDPDGVPWGEPQYRCNMAMDRSRPMWEQVLAFMSAGRASPVIENGKLSVVYQYADEHGDAGITVAAKAPVQLLTSGNVEGLTVTWLQKAGRPTTLIFEFLDEEQRFLQSTEQVDDDESTLDDPSATDKDEYRPETIQAYNVTNRGQVFREGRFRHRAARYVVREVGFRVGPYATGLRIGDLFALEYEILRPYGNDVARAAQVMQVLTSPFRIVIDKHLTGTGLQVLVRRPDGTPSVQVAITSYINGTDGGAVNPKHRCELTLAATITVDVGATCVVGVADKLVDVYELVNTTSEHDGSRQLRAFNWDPRIHAPVTKADFEGTEDEVPLIAPADVVVERDDVDELPPPILGARLIVLHDGQHAVTFGRPGAKVGTVARVYHRAAANDAWNIDGETEGNLVPVAGLIAGTSYEFSVCLETKRGDTVLPDLGDRFTATPEEFPAWAPSAITNLRAAILDGVLLVEWDDITSKDVDYYEVRAGSCWAAGIVLARDRAPRVYVPNPPVGVSIMVAARAASGMYGDIATIAAPAWAPPDQLQVLLENDLSPSPAGTHSDTQWNSTDAVIELASGKLFGTYTSLEQDTGTQLPYYWQVRVDRIELDDATIDDLTFEIDSGEALWRTIDGRPASAGRPGIDWETSIDDLTMTIDELPPSLLVQGHAGECGSHTLVEVESRFEVDGVWSAWKPHYDRRVLARKTQVRLNLFRESSLYRAQVRVLTYAVYI